MFKKLLTILALTIAMFINTTAFAEAVITTTCGLGEGHCGQWTNIYENDPKLRAVRVQQFPDSECESTSNLAKCFSKSKYHAAHPAMIVYVFNDCRVRSMYYSYRGEPKGDTWSRLEMPRDEWLVKGSELKKCPG